MPQQRAPPLPPPPPAHGGMGSYGMPGAGGNHGGGGVRGDARSGAGGADLAGNGGKLGGSRGHNAISKGKMNQDDFIDDDMFKTLFAADAGGMHGDHREAGPDTSPLHRFDLPV